MEVASSQASKSRIRSYSRHFKPGIESVFSTADLSPDAHYFIGESTTEPPIGQGILCLSFPVVSNSSTHSLLDECDRAR